MIWCVATTSVILSGASDRACTANNTASVGVSEKDPIGVIEIPTPKVL